MPDPRIEELKTLLPQCMLPDWVRLGSRLIRLLRDKHHPDKHDALLKRLTEQVRASIALREARRLNALRVSYPPDLPITARKDEIVAAIRDNQVVIIAGETGSGKTTQIPKMCLEAGLGIEAKIGCTQPRRVAALSISRRIAEELNAAWGREVGCTIRFDDRSSPHTYIKLMTDGILLAETQGDPDLSEYNALIIDEAHERSLNIDFLLGYLKGLLARRKDLKLIVTSATIDTEAFSRHFNDAPIIEVSGRMFPVDVFYNPLDANSEESGDISYVDAAVQSAENILYESSFGDVLIFMPGERDIRETSDMLEGRFGRDAEIIPLFGRLSSGDQQRVFAPSARRKIVIATNIAETSLTIPGIRYVIDAGLARISRYNPRTRTKRLPVEPVSQSSANQRKGRAGRVQDGICIRLYSEEDYDSRPPFTQPEIQRANLAEVILRMKAFRLGEIETFPFVQPPSPAAIGNGFALLQELGALDDKRELTPLGRDLARLPIDPTLGRMLLQSQSEHATRELLIIAAGLSIQDPRERPLDQKDAAAAAHKRFNDPQSDFLALLNIWNEVHDQWEKIRTQNARRKFCKQHFLSYLRMREWQDLYSQLHDALEDLGTLKLNESNAAYPAIHRSILAGLIGHVAHREERNTYKASGNREVTVFPGSSLYERGETQKKRVPKNEKQQPKQRTNQPEWIVAGEIVETSQLFARTIAGIDPQWIFQLAPHACKLTHQNPHWSASSGRVLVEEVVTLHGLEVQRRKVAYGNINAKEATEIFIRSALVEENILPARGNRREELSDTETRANAESNPLSQREKASGNSYSYSISENELPAQYNFLSHNRAIRQKIENWQTRVRRYDLADPDQALFDFYAKQIENVSSTHELNRLLGERGNQHFLRVTEADLAGGRLLSFDSNAFPDIVPIGGQPVAVSYAYAPGEENDGVTIKLPFSLAQSVSSALLEWAVPGLREEQISELLRALPKAMRRELMPLPEKVTEIVRDFQPVGPSFLHDLGRFIHQRFGIAVNENSWPADSLPPHLRPRIEVIGNNRKTLGTGRNLNELRERFASVKIEPTKEPRDWQQAAQKWERFGITAWNFGDLPERITVREDADLPVYAWPGLHFEEGNVNLKLFPTPDSARDASLSGVKRLVELAIQRDLGWIEKDLRALMRLDALYAPIGGSEELRETALENLKRHILPSEPLSALTEANFQYAVENAKKRVPGVAQQLMDRVATILQMRQQVQQRVGVVAVPAAPRAKTFNDFSQLGQAVAKPQTNPFAIELANLLPSRFLERVSFDRLPHLPRYLKALLLRAERAKLNPPKDQERVKLLAPFVESLKKLEAAPRQTAETRKNLEEFRWMIEEYKVSLFAQEVGTAIPISPKRLTEQLQRLR
ncbi:MAG: ATP-dependent RNA helicase HrpA [Verrucomicrobia bacterium]|nr:ATP-dependent RNA helicase HrpA [Verrucomicrobiota bacterium]